MLISFAMRDRIRRGRTIYEVVVRNTRARWLNNSLSQEWNDFVHEELGHVVADVVGKCAVAMKLSFKEAWNDYELYLNQPTGPRWEPKCFHDWDRYNRKCHKCGMSRREYDARS